MADAPTREALEAEKAKLAQLLKSRAGERGYEANVRAIQDRLDVVNAQLEAAGNG